MYQYLFRTTREEVQCHELADGSLDAQWLRSKLSAPAAFSSHSDSGAGRLVRGMPEVYALGDTYVKLTLFCYNDADFGDSLDNALLARVSAVLQTQYDGSLWAQPYNAIYWDGSVGDASDGLQRFFDAKPNWSYWSYRRDDNPYTAYLELVHVLPLRGLLNYTDYYMGSSDIRDCVTHLSTVFPNVFDECSVGTAPAEPGFWLVSAIPNRFRARLQVAQVLFGHRATIPSNFLARCCALTLRCARTWKSAR